MDPVKFLMAQAPAETPTAAGSTPAASAPTAPARNGIMALLFQDNAEGRPIIPPLRWQGNFTFEERLARNGDFKSNQTLEYVRLTTATYIREPWFAQVVGNLGLLLSQARTNSNTPDDSQSQAQRGIGVTGGGVLSVFPRSRFPFTATVDVSDSRTSGDAVPTDYQTRLISLRQTYRSPLGDQIYTAGFQRSTLISEAFGHDTVTALNGSMNRTFANRVVDAIAELSENRRSSDGTRNARLYGHDNWRPDDNTTVDTLASLSLNERLGGDNSDRFVQLQSFGTWRPEEDSPLFVTGGARFADAAFDNGGGTAQLRSVSTNASVTYALSQRANVFGAVSAAQSRSDHSSVFAASETLGAAYASAPHRFAGFDYMWHSSGSASNQSSTDGASQRTAQAQLGHQVTRGFRFGEAVQLAMNVSETGGVQRLAEVGTQRTLQHSAGVSMTLTPNPASNALIGLNVGDSRRQGVNAGSFQLANLQLSGNLQMGVFSLLNANLTVQAIRQHDADDFLGEEQARRTSVLRSGNVSYTQQRLFSMRNLRFVATAQFNDVQLESRQLGDVNAPHDQYTRAFESRLEYTIGRLDIRLGTRFAKTDERTDRQLFFRVNRYFGLF